MNTRDFANDEISYHWVLDYSSLDDLWLVVSGDERQVWFLDGWKYKATADMRDGHMVAREFFKTKQTAYYVRFERTDLDVSDSA